jgi:hypothetical protein
MSKATYPLNRPLSIKKAAQRLAKEDGVSLNQWIAAAVAEKVGVVETAADFFKKRAPKATGEGLMRMPCRSGRDFHDVGALRLRSPPRWRDAGCSAQGDRLRNASRSQPFFFSNSAQRA